MCARRLIRFSLRFVPCDFLEQFSRDKNFHSWKTEGAKKKYLYWNFLQTKTKNCRRKRIRMKRMIERKQQINREKTTTSNEWKKENSKWRGKNETNATFELRNRHCADFDCEPYQLPNFFWINNKVIISNVLLNWLQSACGVRVFSQ